MNGPQSNDRRRRPPVTAEPGGVRRRHLLGQGLSGSDVRRGVRNRVLERMGFDLYYAQGSDADASMPIVRLLQALTAGTDSVVSHDSAAALHGLFALDLAAPFDLTVPRGRPQIRRPALVRGHRMRLHEEQVTEVQGIPVTTPARTWVDRAVGQTLEQAVIDADIVLRPPRSEYESSGAAAATREEMDEAVRSRPKARGIRTARLALELARAGADSPQETRLRLKLGEAKLPEPEVNGWVFWPDGRRAFQPDLLFRRYRVCVQYEGRHHSHPDQVERDVARADVAAALGWREVRITRRDTVAGWSPAVAKVARALCQHGWTPPTFP